MPEISEPLPSEVIACFQNIFGFIILFPFMLKDGIVSIKTRWPLLNAIRVSVAVIGVISLYYAFAHMPMTQAVALQLTGPIFAISGAKIDLKEKMGLYRILGVTMGLLGAFVISRPDGAFVGSSQFSWLMLFPLLSALSFAVVKVLNRELSLRGESAELLTTYLLFFMVPASLIPALATWVTPDLPSLFLLALLGGIG